MLPSSRGILGLGEVRNPGKHEPAALSVLEQVMKAGGGGRAGLNGSERLTKQAGGGVQIWKVRVGFIPLPPPPHTLQKDHLFESKVNPRESAKNAEARAGPCRPARN